MRRGPLLTIPPPQAITMRVEMRRGPLLTIAPSGYNYEGRDEAWSFTNHCPPQAITMRVEMRRGPLLTIAPLRL